MQIIFLAAGRPQIICVREGLLQEKRQSTVLNMRAIRQARETWMQDFEALAAYANLADTPDSWQRFRLAWPNFFSDSQGSDTLTESLYSSALDWDRFCSENKEKLVDLKVIQIDRP